MYNEDKIQDKNKAKKTWGGDEAIKIPNKKKRRKTIREILE